MPDDFEGYDEERESVVLEVVRYVSAALAKSDWSVVEILAFINETGLDYELAATAIPNIEDVGGSFEFEEMMREFNGKIAEEVEAGVQRAEEGF